MRPRQGRGAVVSFRVRRFHPAAAGLLTVSRFSGRRNEVDHVPLILTPRSEGLNRIDPDYNDLR